jgi:predicted DNA-binding protein
VKGITIKLPDETLRRLQQEAQASGRTIASLIRERVEAGTGDAGESVYALTSDLAGSLRVHERLLAMTGGSFAVK